LIQFLNVSKTYEGSRVALDRVSFEMGHGEFGFLTGPSGAGKTTLLRLVYREALPDSGQVLIGTHDFSSYRAMGCQAKSPVRTLHSLDVVRRGELIELRVHANAFLHHMIRNIAGVLMAIGHGKRPAGWAAEVLELRDRTLGGVTAPPDGLYFERVWYPARFQIPQPSPVPLALATVPD